ncbi:MAG TPA: hydroxyisourate hydrolase, partial [Pseudobdellovibrionaceae bacterium]|nr:hydroxyisourate hydrolase [Pseudobdellovibrionaceae bacterium]
VTTHVLNTATGAPEKGIDVLLLRHQSGGAELIARRLTNEDGRIEDFLPPDMKLPAGVYILNFDLSQHKDCFFPEVQVSFKVDGKRGHYHVPLLLSPYGYATYRGS